LVLVAIRLSLREEAGGDGQRAFREVRWQPQAQGAGCGCGRNYFVFQQPLLIGYCAQIMTRPSSMLIFFVMVKKTI